MPQQDIASQAAVQGTITRDIATVASVTVKQRVTYLIGEVRETRGNVLYPNGALCLSVYWTVARPGWGSATFERDLYVPFNTSGTVLNQDIVNALISEITRIQTAQFFTLWAGAVDTGAQITTYSAGGTPQGNNIWSGATQGPILSDYPATLAAQGPALFAGLSGSGAVIANNGQITTTGYQAQVITSVSNVTGVTMQPGWFDGQTIYLINVGANNITFHTTPSTSGICDSDVGESIASHTAALFMWESTNSYWFRIKTA